MSGNETPRTLPEAGVVVEGDDARALAQRLRTTYPGPFGIEPAGNGYVVRGGGVLWLVTRNEIADMLLPARAVTTSDVPIVTAGLCAECASSKPQNCVGWALDEDDNYTDCEGHKP